MYAEVAVDTPWARSRTFTYSIPQNLPIKLAHSVWVPFGPKTIQGIVFDITEASPVEDARPITSIIDPDPLLAPWQLVLARWISRRYLSSLFDALALMLPPGFRRRVLTTYFLNPDRDLPILSLNPDQQKVVEHLRLYGATESRDIRKTLGAMALTSVEHLARRGILTREWRWARPAVGPKYVSMVSLAVVREEGRTQLHLLRKGAVQQQRLLEALVQSDAPLNLSSLKELGIGREAVKALEARGLATVEEVRVHRDPLRSRQYQPSLPPTLTDAQQRAWKVVSEALLEAETPTKPAQKPRAFLLRGVTGSGKTEIYLRALEQAVVQGKKGLVLVPEISLTPQTIQRFSSRFPGSVAVLHSKLSMGEQFDEWWRIKQGEFDVVIGSRSALFAPQPDLGLVVLDEEHDSSYKQADPSPRYHAREAALQIASLTGSVVILGSATPDVISNYRALQGEVALLELPTRIATDASPGPSEQLGLPQAVRSDMPLPQVEVVDMRLELKEGNRSIFSRALAGAMHTALKGGEQTILFMNRRGAATFVQCRECGFVLKCRSCDVSLTYHSAKEKLVCHHCGYQVASPQHCPQCNGQWLSYLGTGTQRVEDEVSRRFPKARILRWDRDVTRGKTSHEEILEKFLSHQADILIGTQMIAKGLHMPLVTLVGVVSADVGLNFPDYRANERVFQVLTQVAGRAGRGLLGGRVIIQTFNPHHYVIEAASRHDYLGFYRQEIMYRSQNRNPPYGNLARLVYSHTNAEKAEREAYRMAVRLREERDSRGEPETDILGPAPCYVSRVRGKHRWQVLARTPEPALFLENVTVPEGWVVDIDPITLL